MTVIQRLRNIGGDGGPPLGLGLPGQLAIDFTNPYPDLYVAKPAGAGWVDVHALIKSNITNLQNADGVLATNIAALDTRIDALETEIGALTIADIAGLQTALDGKEPSITGGTTSQFWRGDKTWQALPLASTAAPGLAEIASTIEAEAATDDTRFLTPYKANQFLVANGPALFVGKTGTQQMAGPLGIGRAPAAGVTLDVAGTLRASPSISINGPGDTVVFYTTDEVVRASTGWAPASGIWYLNYFTAAGAYQRTPIMVTANTTTLVGMGTSAHVIVSTGDGNWPLLNIEGPAAAGGGAILGLSASGKTWHVRNVNGDLLFYDTNNNRNTLNLDAGGTVHVGARSDGTAALRVTATTSAASLYLKNNAYEWNWSTYNDGTCYLSKPGVGVLGVGWDGSVAIPNGPLYAGGGLMGGEGNAGRLKMYNTGNYITFQWNGSQVLARIDNGAAVVLLG